LDIIPYIELHVLALATRNDTYLVTYDATDDKKH